MLQKRFREEEKSFKPSHLRPLSFLHQWHKISWFVLEMYWIMTTSNRFARLVWLVTSQWVLFIFQLSPGVIISVVVCNNTNISPPPHRWSQLKPQNVSRSIFRSTTWEQFAKKPKSDPDPSITRINPEIGLVSKWVLFTSLLSMGNIIGSIFALARLSLT